MTPTTMLTAAHALADVLARENAALAAMDLPAAAALLPAKTAALAALTAAGSPEDFGPGAADLVAAARRLNDLARDNHRLLERAIAAQQRVIGIVAGAAASAVPAGPSYRASGRLTPDARPLALSTRA